MRLRTRMVIGYLACALIAATALLLMLRLSFPPDPVAARYRPAPSPPAPRVHTDKDKLTIQTAQGSRTYRFYQTDKGVVAKDVTQQEEQ